MKGKSVHCELPPYEVEEILTLEEAQQKAGWNITAFNLPAAWELTQGEGVKVAVLDTGCDLDHPDLAENLLPGKNFINPARPPEDDNQHGCVSPDCLVHTNFCGIETIEKLYNRLPCAEEQVQHGEKTYYVKNLKKLGLKTYSLDADAQKTVIGEIESIQKLSVTGEVIKVELEGKITYSLTPWHPVYIVRHKHHKVYEIIRKRADEISKGDWFVFPRGKNSGHLVKELYRLRYGIKYVCDNCGHIPKYYLNNHPSKCKKCRHYCWRAENKEIFVEADLAYLAGIVLTDGHIGKDRVEVCSNTDDILMNVKAICDKYGWTSTIENNRILIYGLDCVSILNNLGILKKNKSLQQTLPEFVGKSPYDVICAFIAGVVDGDGCISTTNTLNRVTTASKNFAYKLCALFNSIGLSASINGPSFDRRKNRVISSDNAIYNVVFPSLPKEISQILCHPEKKKRSAIVPRSKRIGRRVKHVTKSNYDGYFYDFTIKDYHNYVGNGHFVSNTHATGTIVAIDNDFGSVGVAPKSKAIPIKVLNSSGGGSLDVVAKGIVYAVDNGADIISMSLGSPRPLAQIRKAIQYADNKGVVVFVAAGNATKGNTYTKQLFYPANYPETIAIGSIDENFMRSDFSNTGESLDLLAPGSRIFSTVPDNWYAILSGTSMASPFAVGVAALCLSYQRKHHPDKPLKGANAYRNLFKKNVMELPDKSKAKKFFRGFGIIDTRDFKKWMDN